MVRNVHKPWVPPDLSDANDRMLLDKELYSLEDECGHFGVDLWCDAYGHNARCKQFYSASRPAQQAKLKGQSVSQLQVFTCGQSSAGMHPVRWGNHENMRHQPEIKWEAWEKIGMKLGLEREMRA